jgi:hypothetical protein
MEALWSPLDILPVATVPVELLDTVRYVAETLLKSVYINSTAVYQTHLESIRMFVTGPPAGVGIEEETLFIFVCDVVIQILSDGELPMELYVRASVSDTPPTIPLRETDLV